MEKEEIMQMRGVFNHFRGELNSPQNYGSDMYNDEVDMARSDPKSLTEIGRDEKDNPIMTSPVAQAQMGAAEPKPEERGMLENVVDYTKDSQQEIFDPLAMTFGTSFSPVNTGLAVANYLTRFGQATDEERKTMTLPYKLKEFAKEQISKRPDAVEWQHSALFENYILNVTPSEKNAEKMRIAKVLGIDDSLLDNRDLYIKAAMAADRVERMGKLREFQTPGGDIDMAKVYTAFPGLAEVQKTQGTAAAALALSNIDGLKTVNDVYAGSFMRFFGSITTGSRRGMLAYERSSIWNDARKENRLPTSEEKKRLDEIEAEMKAMPRYDYGTIAGGVGGMVGSAAENLPMIITSQGAGLAARAAVTRLSGNAKWGEYASNVVGTYMMAQQIAGSQYEELVNKLDKNGKPMYTPEQASWLALGQGYTEAALEQWSLNEIGAAIFRKSATKSIFDIVKKSPSLEAAKTGVKEYVTVAAKEFLGTYGRSFKAETVEEFSQSFGDIVLENLAQVLLKGKDAEITSIEDALTTSTFDAIQAVPAIAGFSIIGGAMHPIANTRAALGFRRQVQNVTTNKALQARMANEHYTETLNGVWANKGSIKELQDKAPEVVTTILDVQNKQAGIENGFVDVKELSKQEGGAEMVQQIAQANNISDEDLRACMDGSGMLQVKTSTLMQMDLSDEQHKLITNNVTTSLDAFTQAQTNSVMDVLRQQVKDLKDFNDKTYKASIDSILSARFKDPEQAKLAREILEANYDNPQEEFKRRLDSVNAELMEIIDPVLEELRSGMKQGVDIVRIEGARNAHYEKVSNNADWYRNYFADYGKAPNNEELIDLAIDIAAGRQNPRYGLQDYQNNTDESREYFAGVAERLDQLKEQRDALMSIKDRMQDLKPSEMVATANLSPEALKVYDTLIGLMGESNNKKIQKAGRLNALLMARYADNMAKVISRVKQKPYTAEDYARERFKVDVNAEYNQEQLQNAAQLYEMWDTSLSGAKSMGDLYDRIFDRKKRGEAPNKIQFTNKFGITFAEQQVVHAVNTHGLTREDLNDIDAHIDKFYNIHLSGWADGDYAGNFNGTSILARIDGDLHSYYLVVEIDDNGVAWFKTAAKNTKAGADKRIEEYSAGRLSDTDKRAAGTDGRSSSIESIKQILGIVNQKMKRWRVIYNAPYWSDFDFNPLMQSAYHSTGANVSQFQDLDLSNKDEIKKFADSLTKDNIPTTEIKKTLISSYKNMSSEGQLQKCQSFVEELTNTDIVDPLGNKVYFEPGNGEDLRTYTFHLIAGEEAALNNDLSKIRIKRILGVHLAPETIKNPLLIIKQKSNGRRMYVSMYNSDIQYANSIVVGVEDGQNGRVVTVTIAGKKEDKKAALREFKKRMSGENTDKVLYIREGLSGYSRPTSGNRTSTDSTTLSPSGNQIITQESDNGNKGLDPQQYNFDALYQESDHTAKGSISYAQDGPRLIRLFESADQSTFIHEMGHMFLLDMQEIAGIDPNSREAKDLKTIMDWAQYKPGQSAEYKGTASAEEFWQREEAIKTAEAAGNTAEAQRLKDVWVQERFARAFEEYLASGEAPSRGLQKAFRQFKKWLVQIYNDALGAGVRATPEVEAIMARMIASEEEIEALAAANNIARLQNIDPDILTEDAEAMRQRWQEEAKEKAKEKLLKELMKQYKQNNLNNLEAQLATVRETAEAELQNVPCFVCEKLLAEGTAMESALDICGFENEQAYRDALKEAGGSLEKALDAVVAQAKENILKQMPSGDALYTMAEEALYSGDYEAQLAEYEAELLRSRESAYDNIPARLRKAFSGLDEAAKNFETEAVRKAARELKYAERWAAKDLETIQELERYLAELEKQGAEKDKIREQFEQKYKELKQRTVRNEQWLRGVRDATKGKVKALQAIAAAQLENEPVSVATNARHWHRSALKEAKRAWDNIARAQRKGEEIDYNEAVRAKEQQAIYNAMTAQAIKNKKEVDKWLNGRQGMYARGRRMADQRVKANADMRYFHNHLLYIFGLRNTDANRPVGDKSFTQLLTELRNSHQFEEEVPGWLIAAAELTEPGKTYQQLTMDELNQLNQLTRVLYRLAINDKGLLTMDVDMETIQAECAKDFANNVDYETGGQRINELTGAIGSYMNSLLKSETFLSLLGGEHGAHIRYIYRTLFTAAENEEKAQEKEAEALKALYGSYYTKQELRAILNDPVMVTADGKTQKLTIGADTNITKEHLLCMALNWGNETNRARLLVGLYGCENEQELMQREGELMVVLQENLSEKDWQFVQAMWNHIGSFADTVSNVLEKSIGLPLKRVKAEAFTVTLPNGKTINMDGGYFPIVKDSGKSSKQTEFEQIEEAKALGGVSVFGTGMGTTKDRAASKFLNQGPLKLSLDVVHNHIQAQIHLINMRMAVRDAYKVLNSKTVKDQITNTFGPETFNILNDWVLNCWAPPVRANEISQRIASQLRSGSIGAIMAYRVSTALLNFANIVYMANEIGPVNTINAIVNFYKNRSENREAIMAVSVYMRNRAMNMDRDLNAQNEQILKRHNMVGNAVDKATGGKSEEVRYLLDKYSNYLIEQTDMVFSLPLYHWQFVQTYNAELAKGVSEEDARETANYEATRRVTKVFPSSRKIDASSVQRSRDEFTKLLTPFFSFANTMMNAVWSKYYEGKYNGRVAMTDERGNVVRNENGDVVYTTAKKNFIRRYGRFVIAFMMDFMFGAALETWLRGIPDALAGTGGGGDDDGWDVLGVRVNKKALIRNSLESSLGGFYLINTVFDAETLASAVTDGKVSSYGGRGIGVLSGTLQRAGKVGMDVFKLAQGKESIDMLDFMRDITRAANAKTGFSDTLTDALFNTARFAADEGYSLDNMDDLREYIAKTLFDRKLKKK